MKYWCILISVFALNISFSQGDDCASALQLTNLSNYCSSGGTYTNETSTVSLESLPSCWNSTNKYDVWFKFIAIGTEVQITIKGNGQSTGATLSNPDVVLNSGTCGNNIQLKCNSGTANSVDFAAVYNGVLTIGTTYYIRVGTSSTNRGNFDLCINNYTTVPNPNDPNDCNHATIICNKDALSVGEFNGSGSDVTESTLGCFKDAADLHFTNTIESNSCWLTMMVPILQKESSYC